ncbi:hypothetical protein D3C77_347920 [compost metagenome]
MIEQLAASTPSSSVLVAESYIVHPQQSRCGKRSVLQIHLEHFRFPGLLYPIPFQALKLFLLRMITGNILLRLGLIEAGCNGHIQIVGASGPMGLVKPFLITPNGLFQGLTLLLLLLV